MGQKKGIKLDKNKNRVGLVFGGFSEALWDVSKVGTFGAKKYTDHGWMSVTDGQERYLDALYRHLLQHQMGEVEDSESGLSHLAHAAWNALAILQLSNK